MTKSVLTIARELMPLPTAPYREHAVRDYVKSFCKARRISTRTDDMGNVIATFGAKYKNPVLAFGAHMDHPGFIIEKDSTRQKTTALFYGGIQKTYFKAAKVRSGS